MKNAAQITDSIKTFYKEKRWQGRIILALLIVTLILGLARLLLPPTIIYSATSWLKKQGIDATIEAINIDIIDGTVSLLNAKGQQDGTPLFNIGLIEIDWSWTPLSEKTIAVTRIGLDEFSVHIKKYDDEIIVSGVHIPLGKSPDSELPEAPAGTDITDEEVKHWAASIGEVIFTNLNVCYLQHTAAVKQADKNSLFADYCVELEEMSWAGSISYATDDALLKSGDIPLSSTGDFTLKGLSVSDNKLDKKLLLSKSNTLNNVVISGLNKLHIDKLDMQDLSLLQREDKEHSDSIRFHQLSIDDINLSNLNELTIKNISVSKPGFYLVKQSATDWEYQQWIPQSSSKSKADTEAKQDTDKTEASSFKVSLDTIDVSDSDLCYQDNETSLYYCLTFAGLNWEGSINYDTKPANADTLGLLAKGDLKLTQPNVHNQTIDRNLVNFSSMQITGLEATGTESISLSKLALDKLNALQRSKEADDNTASFDSLAIDDIKYSNNNIAINTIELKGLASAISKDKKGNWEHDKWLTKDKTGEQAKTDKEKPATDKKESPLVIALNKVSISTDNKILFIDNSTTPTTKVGLQKLAFNISKLYTSKPGANSPFTLNAKTIRHSTMDIKGTAKPFAEKVSFKADGKLKGFDLRATSPTTKKEIGHIIQSGQLDAELDLKAVEGVLDSNIALSLYQFQMRSVSKKDAEKLDEKFGMPLNQTLVLLRDKDDSIHLDIPITGDVNKPDFDPMDAIIKATSKAATVTLITFYTPYGLIYAGGNLALNLATALNFDPIEFTAGTSEIQTKGKEQLDNLSKLLVEKPQVRLSLCGITNKQDALALYPELNAKKESKDKKPDAKLTKEQLLKLNQLARERQINSKNYLIEKHSIDHSRLILCAPEHKDSDEGVSGVEINI